MLVHVKMYIGILGIISIILMVLRTRIRRRTFGRFVITFFTSIFWIAFIVLLGYKIGYATGDQGISLLKLLHIKK